jgi:hypothetical protein
MKLIIPVFVICKKQFGRIYTQGVDLRINGEFVKGIESWATIGYLKTMENISDDRKVTYFNSDGDTIVPWLYL